MNARPVRVRLDDAPGARILVSGSDVAARSDLLDRVISDAVVADRSVHVARPGAASLGLSTTAHEWTAIDVAPDGSGAVLVVDDLAALDDWADRSLAAWLDTEAAASVTVVAGAPIDGDPARVLVDTGLRTHRALLEGDHQLVVVDALEAAPLTDAAAIARVLELVRRESVEPEGIPAAASWDELVQLALQHVLDPGLAHRLAALAAATAGDPTGAQALLGTSADWSRRRDDTVQAMHDLHMQEVLARRSGDDGRALDARRRRTAIATRAQHASSVELVAELRADAVAAGNRELELQAELLAGGVAAADHVDAASMTPWRLIAAARTWRVTRPPHDALAPASAALAAARVDGDRAAEAHALETLALVLSDLGRVADAVRVVELVGDLLRAEGATTASATVALWSALLDTMLLRHARVVATCNAALRSLAGSRHVEAELPTVAAALHACGAAAQAALGDLDGARRASQVAVDLLDERTPQPYVDLAVSMHLGVLVDIGDERALARRRTELAGLSSDRAAVSNRMRVFHLRHLELRDGWTDEVERLALELPTEIDWHAIVHAGWLVRMGIRHDSDAAIAQAEALLGALEGLRDPRELLTIRSARTLVAFMRDVTVAPDAVELVDAWASHGMRLGAARMQLSIAIIAGRHGDGVDARRRCLDARAEFVALGARDDARQTDLVEADLRRRRVGRRRPGRARTTAAPALPNMLRSPHLSAAVREQLQPSVSWVRLEPDARLFDAGTPARHVFVVHSGMVRLTRDTGDGNELVVAIAGPGDLVGELAARGRDGDTHTLAAHALGDALVARILGADVHDAATGHPELRDTLHDIVADRADLAVRQAHAIAYQPVPARLAGALHLLADRFGHPTLDGHVLVPVPVTQAQLAAMIGAARQTTSRAMGELVAAGIVEQRDRRIVVRDLPALSTRAAG